MKAARLYASLTGRGLMGNTLTWMQELVEEFGDDEVAESLEEHALDVPADKLLGRVRDVLARRRLLRSRSSPPELTMENLLHWVRHDDPPASFPAIWDAGRMGLSEAEWQEVGAWAARGRRPRQA